MPTISIAVSMLCPSKRRSVIAPQAIAHAAVATSVIAIASAATGRTTDRTSSPVAVRSAMARDSVCSTGRKSTTATRNIAAHSTAIGP